jgi:hypothetical protein
MSLLLWPIRPIRPPLTHFANIGIKAAFAKLSSAASPYRNEVVTGEFLVNSTRRAILFL